MNSDARDAWYSCTAPLSPAHGQPAKLGDARIDEQNAHPYALRRETVN